MPLERQFTHFKEVRKPTNKRKIEVKSDILTEDTSFLLEDELTEGSWYLKKIHHGIEI